MAGPAMYVQYAYNEWTGPDLSGLHQVGMFSVHKLSRLDQIGMFSLHDLRYLSL